MAAAAGLAPPAGRRIAVVGAAGGIGRALVEALRNAGCTVIGLDLATSLHRHPLPAGVLALAIDATDPDSLARAAQRCGPALDGAVLLAGFAAPRTPAVETDLETWSEVVTGNLTTSFLAARALVPLLRLGTAPSLVTMASGLAVRATPGYAPYGAAKAGVLALTRSLAVELAPTIRINAVAPGAVDTAFLRGGTGRSDETQEPRLNLDAYAASVPLQRIATPDDIVGPILFLLGPASSYLTGQTLHVNGGLVMP